MRGHLPPFPDGDFAVLGRPVNHRPKVPPLVRGYARLAAARRKYAAPLAPTGPKSPSGPKGVTPPEPRAASVTHPALRGLNSWDRRLNTLTNDPLPAPASPVAPAGAVGEFRPHDAGHGWSHHYFADDRHFYKLPARWSSLNQVHSEPAATEAMRVLGNDVLPAEQAKSADGHTYIRYPKLGRHTTVSSVDPLGNATHHDDTFDRHAKPDLHRLALSEWLVHAGDRHGENYVVPEGGRAVKPIDYGDSWHPANGNGDRVVGLGGFGANGEHVVNHYYGRGAIKNSDPLDPALLQDVLGKEGKIKEIAERGIAGLSDQHKAEARQLLDDKFRHLETLANQPGGATWGHIPTFNGLDVAHMGGVHE